jgi:hypothetical protein
MAFSFSPQAAAEYQRLFDTCVINLDKLPEIKPIVNKILNGKAGMKLWKIKLEYPGILSASHIALRLDVISIHTFIMAIR